MGKKIVCESCGTIFPFERAKDLKVCPVCNASFDDEENIEDSAHDEEPSFGEGVKLSENDSFDEDKIDFWWYDISEPGSMGNSSSGLTHITCSSCGHLSATSYPISKRDNYILLDPRAYAKCSHCGKVLKNHILLKRPESWVDPRQRDMWKKDYDNLPKCPICHSTKIHKISMTNKAASALTFGIFAVGHVSKTYKCEVCGSKF